MISLQPRPLWVTLRAMRAVPSSSSLALTVLVPLALAAAGALTGCTDKTSLLVEVASPDLSVPMDVDALRFDAWTVEDTFEPWRVTHTVAIDGPWPHSLAILPGPADTSAELIVSVTGLIGGVDGDFAVRRTAQTRFIAGGENRLILQLTRACRGVECDPGVDCVAGMCTDVVVPPDAGMDGGPDTGAMDSGMPDTGAIDSSMMDSSMMDTGMPPDTSMMDTSVPDACIPAPEVCSGRDEDCDSMIDEGLPCLGTLVISEISTGGPAGGSDEFVEIYNRTDSAIDIASLEVEYQSSAGTTWGNRATIPAGAMIGPRGFYLVGSANYSRPVILDPGGGWASGFNRLGGHLRLSVGLLELDRVGWGTAMNPEGSAAPELADDAVNTFERKAVATSTAATMESGGADAARGNGHDSDDNAADFIERSTAGPQNSSSPSETP